MRAAIGACLVLAVVVLVLAVLVLVAYVVHQVKPGHFKLSVSLLKPSLSIEVDREPPRRLPPGRDQPDGGSDPPGQPDRLSRCPVIEACQEPLSGPG